MTFSSLCFVDNIQYLATPKRTYLLLDNITNTIKISYFDIINFVVNKNILILNMGINKKNEIIIKGSNVKNLYTYILHNITILNYDFEVYNLITNVDKSKNDETQCIICLDETNKDTIIKLNCCKNTFHLNCFKTYMKSRVIYCCPICRDDNLIYKEKKNYCICI